MAVHKGLPDGAGPRTVAVVQLVAVSQSGVVIDYQVSPEIQPLLAAVEERFEYEMGYTSADALAANPHDDTWANRWLEILQEVGDHRLALFVHAATDVHLSMPGLDATIKYPDEARTEYSLISTHATEMSEAAKQWRFASARDAAQQLESVIRLQTQRLAEEGFDGAAITTDLSQLVA